MPEINSNLLHTTAAEILKTVQFRRCLRVSDGKCPRRYYPCGVLSRERGSSQLDLTGSKGLSRILYRLP
jgi:hypothetical protein